MTDRRKIPAAPPAPTSAEPGEVMTETPAHSDWSSRLLALEGRAPLDLDVDDLRRDGP
ncbi:hypothetical protein ACETKC_00265 [Brevundimonas intermedia]|uniref:hypothetical protein n=1 Tax=Brevundimonas intermedia TaxID=74315 RepID=UPI0022F29132|nr:hypothetical protein [Brevundimonas intermedia]